MRLPNLYHLCEHVFLIPLSLVKVLFCSIFSSSFIAIWHRNQTQSFPVAHFLEWLSIILEEKVDQDSFYHFTTLELPLLLFWEVITSIASLRDASASPLAQLLSRLSFSFAPIVSILFNLDSVSNVFSKPRLFLTETV